MSGFGKQPEKSDDTHEQQIGGRGIDDDDVPLDLENPLLNIASSASASSTEDGGMEDLYNDIFHVLSNVELHATLPEEAIVATTPSSTILKAQNIEKGESSGKKTKSSAPEFPQSDGERRDSKKCRTSPQKRRSRLAVLHNISEKIRRDRIRRKLKALQDLIPNCNTRDKASMLDEAVKYIKALQNQILFLDVYEELQVMSSGAGAMLQTQNPLMLQAPYQGVQVAQYPSQFMPMRPGMGMYGGPSSPALPGMPFALPNPCQSTLTGSGMAMVGPMSQLQMPLNPFQSFSSPDSTLTAASASYTSFPSAYGSTSHGDSADFCEAPVRSQVLHFPLKLDEKNVDASSYQEPVLSGSSGIVLPSQVITPATSSSTSLVSEVLQICDEDKDSGPSQRT